MFESSQTTTNGFTNEFETPFEMTSEQWISALSGEREPAREYAADSPAETVMDRRDAVASLERHANVVVNGSETRQSREHSRDVENVRTIGQVATLICSYRDYEIAA